MGSLCQVRREVVLDSAMIADDEPLFGTKLPFF